MGQQPNIELRLEDLPRPTSSPGAPEQWSPDRPGELSSPEDVPWGGSFGTPGPDPGYALRLVAERPMALAEGERREIAETAVAALMKARASHFGRGPTRGDAEVAELLLGYAGEASDELVDLRRRFLGDRSETARRLLTAVDPDVLTLDAESIREKRRAGDRLIDL